MNKKIIILTLQAKTKESQAYIKPFLTGDFFNEKFLRTLFNKIFLEKVNIIYRILSIKNVYFIIDKSEKSIRYIPIIKYA